MPNIWIKPYEYMLFWADKDEGQGDFHCNFKLSSGGEYIGVFDDDNGEYKLIDEVYFDVQKTDISYGRYPDGEGEFDIMKPTPGNPNASVGTLDLSIENKVVLIPNPASSLVKVELPEGICTKLNISIFDMNGILVDSEIKSNKNFIDISDLKSGVYFIRINCNQKHLDAMLLKI